MTRRRAFVAVGLALIAPRWAVATGQPRITVYKTPTCGCCALWVDHLRAHGFEVVVHDVPSTNAQRRRAEVPTELGSCHTALVAGYSIEGHVPAREILKLLRERPSAIGLAVPGMPIGSPGMEDGNRVAPYDVLLFDRAGNRRVYAQYGSAGAQR